MEELQLNEVYQIQERIEKGIPYHVIKRIIDIVASFLGIIFLFIPCMIIAIIIKKDGGPIFFIQRRVGQDGKKFGMYKFRSMCMDAEEKLQELMKHNEMDGPMFKIKDDPRVTKIGKFIRRTSIDELPQLINVLKGEMSLVGPRPSLPKEVAQFNEFHKLRLKAKPGITCYWQVRGRNDIGFEEWMELDVQYCLERNTLVDIGLVFKTVGVLFGDKNAS